MYPCHAGVWSHGVQSSPGLYFLFLIEEGLGFFKRYINFSVNGGFTMGTGACLASLGQRRSQYSRCQLETREAGSVSLTVLRPGNLRALV